MPQDDLKEYLKREPFPPFRLYLSPGAFVDICQPQLAGICQPLGPHPWPVH